MKKIVILILTLFSIIYLCACGEESLSVEITGSVGNNPVQGADDSGTVSVAENGVLKLEDQHLMYYDYTTQKEYIICQRANCNHNDDSCSGWYDGYNGAKGLAEYGGLLYCFIYNEEKNTLDFIQMERDGSNRKVISKIKRGDNASGNWFLEQTDTETYYAGGKVFVVLDWKFRFNDHDDVQTQQCIAIDLESGSILPLTERKKESIQCYIDAISKDYCIINLSGESEKILSEKEFYRRYESGDFSSFKDIMDAEDPYSAYYISSLQKIPKWYKMIMYDFSNNQISLLTEGNLEKAIDENGEYYADFQPFYINSIYGDYAIIETFVEKIIEDEQSRGACNNNVYKWDLKNNKTELILSLDNGYVYDAGAMNASIIVDKNKLLYLKRKPGLKADYYSYNLDTGEEKRLFEAERNVPYRIVGETKTSFIYYTADDTKKTMYMIKKSDYYKGSFDESIRLTLLDEEF